MGFVADKHWPVPFVLSPDRKYFFRSDSSHANPMISSYFYFFVP